MVRLSQRGEGREEGQIEVLWGLSSYNLENHLSKRIQNCRYKIRNRHWKEPLLVTGHETEVLLASQLISFEDDVGPVLGLHTALSLRTCADASLPPGAPSPPGFPETILLWLFVPLASLPRPCFCQTSKHWSVLGLTCRLTFLFLRPFPK